MIKILLWSDIPPESRVTEAMLCERGMADHKGWVEKQLLRQANPSCHAAVRYAPWTSDYSGIFQPCGSPAIPGSKFCRYHGGGPKIWRIGVLQRRLIRLDEQIRTLRARRAGVVLEMASLKKVEASQQSRRTERPADESFEALE